MSRKHDHPPTTKPGDWYGVEGCAVCGKPLHIVSIWKLGKHFWTHAR